MNALIVKCTNGYVVTASYDRMQQDRGAKDGQYVFEKLEDAVKYAQSVFETFLPQTNAVPSDVDAPPVIQAVDVLATTFAAWMPNTFRGLIMPGRDHRQFQRLAEIVDGVRKTHTFTDGCHV